MTGLPGPGSPDGRRRWGGPEESASLHRPRRTVGFRTPKGTGHAQGCRPAGPRTFRGHCLTVRTSCGLTEKGPVPRKSLRSKRAGHRAPERSNSRAGAPAEPRKWEKVPERSTWVPKPQAASSGLSFPGTFPDYSRPSRTPSRPPLESFPSECDKIFRANVLSAGPPHSAQGTAGLRTHFGWGTAKTGVQQSATVTWPVGAVCALIS